MILKCEICGIAVDVPEEVAEAIFEKKRLQPNSKFACTNCFAQILIPPHYNYDPETGYRWREAP